jgi:hypothetical protein
MALALVAGIGLAAACGPAPASYRLVSLEEAQKLLIDPGVALVDAVSDDTDQPEPLPSGVRWRIADAAAKPPAQLARATGVLIVASSKQVAHRGAAVLARERNRSVYVYIPRSARERSSLYARARDIEEKSGG